MSLSISVKIVLVQIAHVHENPIEMKTREEKWKTENEKKNLLRKVNYTRIFSSLPKGESILRNEKQKPEQTKGNFAVDAAVVVVIVAIATTPRLPSCMISCLIHSRAHNLQFYRLCV